MKSLIPGGYILLCRKLLKSGILKKPPLYLSVWIYLLLSAQHKPYKDLEIGQLRTSISEIQKALTYKVGCCKIKPPKTNIHRVLDWLRLPVPYATRKEPMIGTARGTHKMLVTIYNYECYQNPDNYERDYERNGEKHHQWDTMNKNALGKGGVFGKGRESSNNYISKVTSKDISVKKSWKDFPTLTEDHQVFIETFLKWVQREHPTNWQGWVTDAGSELICYNQQWNLALDTIDKLQRLDEYTTDQIILASRWAMKDKFWKQQFMSIAKLRRRPRSEKIGGVIHKKQKYIVTFLAKQKKSGEGKMDAWFKRMEARDK